MSKCEDASHPRGPYFKREKALALFLFLVGGAIVTSGLFADQLGIGGAPGIGPAQFLLAMVGVAVLGNGLAWSFPRTRRFLQRELGKVFAGAQESVPLSRLCLFAVWFGLVFGLAEAVSIFIDHVVFQRDYYGAYMILGPHLFWASPLSALFFFLLSIPLLSLMILFWSKFGNSPIVVFAFSFLGFYSLVVDYPLEVYAGIIIAAGFAVVTARFIANNPQTFYLLTRRTTVWLMALVIGLFLGIHGWEGFSERQAMANTPVALQGSPNVLLIVLDTVRAKSLGLYGSPRSTTPQLERLAKTGVTFERAIATAPWTTTSHASMFTGQYPHQLSNDWITPLDATFPTLAEVLYAKGYVTAGFVANTTHCASGTGLSRGFVHYENSPLSLQVIVFNSRLGKKLLLPLIRHFTWFRSLMDYSGPSGRWVANKKAPQVNADFLTWLSENKERPFFVFLNYFDAHHPYLPPSPFEEMFRREIEITKKSGGEKPLKRVHPSRSEEVIQSKLGAYEGEIAFLDHHLGRLFHELEKRGHLRNTLVIITSDHGEQFGEHGLTGHGTNLYRSLLHVPLMMSFPSHLPEGLRVRQPVTLANLPGWVMELLHSEKGAPFPMDSLQGYLEDSGKRKDLPRPIISEVSQGISWDETLPFMKGDMKSFIKEGYHYIRNGDGQEELYDFEHDIQEEHDLIDTVESRERLLTLRESLESVLQKNKLKLAGILTANPS